MTTRDRTHMEVGFSQTLRSSLQNANVFVTSASMPSESTMAKEAILRMMSDPDVESLEKEVKESLKLFAMEIASSIHWNSSIRIAVFGDAEEGCGEISVSDRRSRREMQVMIKGQNEGRFWMSGDQYRLVIELGRIDQVPQLVTLFQSA